MTTKRQPFPRRKDSDASEADFFDIPDEPILAILKRQFRHIRTWVILCLIVLLLLWLRRESPKPQPQSHVRYDLVDWSRYAYTTYATSGPYLCNALMVFEALHRLGSRADRILFYPEEWTADMGDESSREGQMLRMAKQKYNVQLTPIGVQMIKSGRGSAESWDKSISKLLAFGETQYERVIHLDTDITVLQTMDELFFLPQAQVAMPRAYWNLPDLRQLSSLLIVIEPSYREFDALMETADAARYGQLAVNISEGHMYDMELLNDRYLDTALVLPHRQYGLITGEFRTKSHRSFMGNEHEDWDPDRALAEAKFVHFSDWPLPKPWIMWPQALLPEMLPRCANNPGTAEESGCRDRDVWRGLYDDFRKRRKNICRLLSFPAPDWPPKEHSSDVSAGNWPSATMVA